MSIMEVARVWADMDGVNVEFKHQEGYSYSAVGCSIGVGGPEGFDATLDEVWVDFKLRRMSGSDVEMWAVQNFPWREFCGTPTKIDTHFIVVVRMWRFTKSMTEWYDLPSRFCDISGFAADGRSYGVTIDITPDIVDKAKVDLGLVAPPPTCEEITTEAECVAAGCYWYDGACHSTPPKPCEEYTTQAECEAAGCYWYDGLCHSIPKPTEPGTWPWPLNMVQDWFEGLWNHITEQIAWAVGRIWEILPTWIKDALNMVGSMMSWLEETLWSKILLIKDSLVENATWLVNTLTNTINVVSTWINSSAAWLRDQVSSIVSSVMTWISDAVGSISNFVWEKIQWLQTTLQSGLDWVTTSVNKFVNDVGDWIGSQLVTIQELLSNAINSGIAWVVDQLTAAYEASKDWFDTIVHGALSGVAEALGEGLKALINWFLGGLQSILETLVNYVTGAITWFKQAFVDLLTDLTNQIREGLTAGSPPKDLEEALIGLGKDWQDRVLEQIEAVAMSPITPEQSLSVATGIAGVGLGVTGLALALGVAADASHPVKEWGIKDAAKLLLAYLGVEHTIAPIVTIPYNVGVLRPLTQYFESVYKTNLPGTGDLIRFVVREVITPEDFYKQMPKLGFSDFWARAYWEAHWVLPSTGDLYDAFHREVITEAELNKFIVWHDFKPESRPGITKSDLEIMAGIRKTLIPRVDLRRAWELGAITDEELLRRYQWLGYEEDAELMAEIQRRVALDAEQNEVRRAHVRQFKDGFMSEAELRAKLTELNVPEKRVEFYIKSAIIARETDLLNEKVKVILESFKNGIITEIDARGRLQELKMDPDLIQELIEFQKMKQKVETETVKTLTRAQILSAFKQKFIDDAGARKRLEAMAYKTEDIDLMIEMSRPTE